MNKHEKNVAPNQVFYLYNGTVLNNLKELYDEIGHMSDDVFFHHVNSNRHDFSIWVHDVMGEKALAAKMAKAGTPVMMKEVLRGVFQEDEKVVKTAAKKPVTAKKAGETKKTAAPKKPATKTGTKKA